MYRPRRSRDLPEALTFGGRVPAAVGLLLVAIGVASLATWVAKSWFWAGLFSGTLASLQLWRLVTYALVVGDPLNLIFALIGIYFFGPPLVFEWGERRFLGASLVITIGAALATLLLGALLHVQVAYIGVWPLLDAMVLLWALRNPEQQVLLMFVVPVTGRVMGYITVGIPAVMALYAVITGGLGGLVTYAPLLAAVGIAWLLAGARIGIPRRWRLAWRDWRTEQQLRRRSRHLKVVDKNGRGPDQWMN
jgi:membrane associated rhomboid family serine protease